jgi:putative colanic acid biosynthesis UDP-glucose lipid carrier transferase
MIKRLYLNVSVRVLIDFCTLVLAFLLTRDLLALKGASFDDPANKWVLGFSFLCWWYTGITLHLFEDYRNRPFALESIRIMKTIMILGCCLTFLFFYVLKSYAFPRTFTLTYTSLIFVLITVEKFMVKQVMIYYPGSSIKEKKILIVGASQVGLDFYSAVLQNNNSRFQIAGFIDEDKLQYPGAAYLGNLSQLPEVLDRTEIDDVFVALPQWRQKEIREVIGVSEKNAKQVRIIPHVHRSYSRKTQMSLVEGVPVLTLSPTPLDDPAKQRLKRTVDLCFTIILSLLVLSWLCPLIALAVRLTSRGPVLFKQERWGLGNRRIVCYKFRTMYHGCFQTDTHGKYAQARKKDKRITPLGAILRKTSLDELPQFFNVLLGNMSVVGPRPHPTPLNLESGDKVQNYMRRHTVKPGITGWAQVNHLRGETRIPSKMQDRVNLDLWYIENWNIWLDLQILCQTFINLVKGDEDAG